MPEEYLPKGIERKFTSAPRISLVVQSSSEHPSRHEAELGEEAGRRGGDGPNNAFVEALDARATDGFFGIERESARSRPSTRTSLASHIML
jgi:hypothetical protein